ncbi:hypothetical protein ASG29_00485 [Sphingomonas sp. Leaf412]|nr:hypothetical protein ASG29_00485 [Sphingomonas sp. Leaf412]
MTLPPAAAVVPVGDSPIEWSASPARALHEQLMRSFAAPAPVRPDRLPVGARLGIIGVATLVPWIAILGGWALLA